MAKYTQCDARLLTWLGKNRFGVTTAKAIKALRIIDPTTQRHISRRFTQLEDKGVLLCELHGTMRVCKVLKDPPATLAKPRWRRPVPPALRQLPSEPGKAIPAEDSVAYEAAGGTIEKLPNNWDKAPQANLMGINTFSDLLNTLD